MPVRGNIEKKNIIYSDSALKLTKAVRSICEPLVSLSDQASVRIPASILKNLSPRRQHCQLSYPVFTALLCSWLSCVHCICSYNYSVHCICSWLFCVYCICSWLPWVHCICSGVPLNTCSHSRWEATCPPCLMAFFF